MYIYEWKMQMLSGNLAKVLHKCTDLLYYINLFYLHLFTVLRLFMYVYIWIFHDLSVWHALLFDLFFIYLHFDVVFVRHVIILIVFIYSFWHADVLLLRHVIICSLYVCFSVVGLCDEMKMKMKPTVRQAARGCILCECDHMVVTWSAQGPSSIRSRASSAKNTLIWHPPAQVNTGTRPIGLQSHRDTGSVLLAHAVNGLYSGKTQRERVKWE